MLTMLCGAAACDWQTDLVALRSTAKDCVQTGAPCLGTARIDAGKDSGTDSGATDGDSAVGAEPACADANSCAPAPAVVEQCSARTCMSADATDTFCADDGLVFALGDGCTSADQNPDFQHALCTQTDLIVKAKVRVTGDVSVDRDLSLSDQLIVDGALNYAGMLFMNNSAAQASASATIQGQPACDPTHALQVNTAASVQARATDNDNARAQSQLAQLTRWTGQQSITLPCGRYYLSGIDGDGSMDVQANGNVALFVDGGISVTQGLQIHAAASARVTIVVNGSVHVIGGLQLGELSDARHLLISAQQVHLEQGDNAVGGILYVQSEELLLVKATLKVQGAVFAYRAQLEGSTSVTHAPSAGTAAAGCNP